MEALRHPQVIILALACFCYITNSVGLSSWLPTIVRRISGLSTTQVVLISGIPWLCAIPVMFLTAWHSDKTRERRWHTAIPLFLVGIAMSLACGRRQPYTGDRRLLGGDHGALLVPVAVLGVAHSFWADPQQRRASH